MASVAEKFISPQTLYDDPSRFAGVMGTGLDTKTGEVDLSLARSVHTLQTSLFPDWPEKLSASLEKVMSRAEGKCITFYSPGGSMYAYPIDVTEFVKE